MKINLIQFIQENRILIATYLTWVLIHFILLFTSKGENTHLFYPFIGEKYAYDWLDTYDYTEFVVYCITPIFIYFIYLLLLPIVTKLCKEL